MFAYVIRRLWQMVPTLLGVVLLVFGLFNFVGGDPAYLLAGKISNPEQIENIRRQQPELQRRDNRDHFDPDITDRDKNPGHPRLK